MGGGSGGAQRGGRQQHGPAGSGGTGCDHHQVGTRLERLLRAERRAGGGDHGGRSGGEHGQGADPVQGGADVVPRQVGSGHEGEVPGGARFPPPTHEGKGTGLPN